jgi:uncharacterized protein YaeQ
MRRVALPATLRRFAIALSDADRGVYEALDLRAAQHPSEAERYLVARVLARCLEHGEGVELTRGLAAAEEPAIWQRDLRGELVAWIEVGSPSVERLHRASKTGARVAVYAWQRAAELAREIAQHEVHRRQDLELFSFDWRFLERVAEQLDRNNRWQLSVSGGALYLEIGSTLHESSVERIAIP